MPRFAANPDAYLANLPEIPPLKEPESLAGAAAAVEAGKGETKPAVLLFADKSTRTEAFVKILSDPAIADVFGKVAYAKVEFDKDSEDAKKWKVTAAPVIVVLDPTGAEPKLLKTIKSFSAASLKKDLEEAAKKLKPSRP